MGLPIEPVNLSHLSNQLIFSRDQERELLKSLFYHLNFMLVEIFLLAFYSIAVILVVGFAIFLVWSPLFPIFVININSKFFDFFLSF